MGRGGDRRPGVGARLHKTPMVFAQSVGVEALTPTKGRAEALTPTGGTIVSGGVGPRLHKTIMVFAQNVGAEGVVNV